MCSHCVNGVMSLAEASLRPHPLSRGKGTPHGDKLSHAKGALTGGPLALLIELG